MDDIFNLCLLSLKTDVVPDLLGNYFLKAFDLGPLEALLDQGHELSPLEHAVWLFIYKSSLQHLIVIFGDSTLVATDLLAEFSLSFLVAARLIDLALD